MTTTLNDIKQSLTNFRISLNTYNYLKDPNPSDVLTNVPYPRFN